MSELIVTNNEYIINISKSEFFELIIKIIKVNNDKYNNEKLLQINLNNLSP